MKNYFEIQQEKFAEAKAARDEEILKVSTAKNLTKASTKETIDKIVAANPPEEKEPPKALTSEQIKESLTKKRLTKAKKVFAAIDTIYS